METVRPLTTILKELDFVRQNKIIDALQSHPVSMPLGNLLVELGSLRQKDLQLALDVQTGENSARPFEQILIDQGLIEENTLWQTKALKLGLPYVEPDMSEIDRSLFSLAPANWFRKHNLTPIRREMNLPEIGKH